jgi:5-methylcytosine-specific restriction endonuclease McrA
MKYCIRCQTIVPPTHNHKGRARTRRYFDAARAVRANATTCWLCGKPFTQDDPPVADHVLPRAEGGTDHITNLRAAHRSCNGRRGQAMRE